MAKKRAAKNRQRAGLLRGAFAAQRENPENISPDLSQKGKRSGTISPAGVRVGRTSQIIAEEIGVSARTVSALGDGQGDGIIGKPFLNLRIPLEIAIYGKTFSYSGAWINHKI